MTAVEDGSGFKTDLAVYPEKTGGVDMCNFTIGASGGSTENEANCMWFDDREFVDPVAELGRKIEKAEGRRPLLHNHGVRALRGFAW